MDIAFTTDPTVLLDNAGEFLRANPVQNNLILTIVTNRAEDVGTKGLYGWATRTGEVVGALSHSPTDAKLLLTTAHAEIAAQLATEVADRGVRLPGVNGPAGVSATFAGRWSELAATAVTPEEARRLYMLNPTDFSSPARPAGAVRPATAEDLEHIASWRYDMLTEIGDTPSDSINSWAEHVIDTGRVWVWQHDAPAAMVVATQPLAGVARIGAVYTPPDQRRRGIGAAAAAAVTEILLDEGSTPILYAQTANRTANGIYRRLGYRAVQEVLLYSFTDPPPQ